MKLYKNHQHKCLKNRRFISSTEGIFLLKALYPKKLIAETTLMSKILLKSFIKSLMDPSYIVVFLVVSAVVFGGGVVILTYNSLAEASVLVSMYEQISSNPEIIKDLEILYPSLTLFNEKSAILLQELSLNRLTFNQCEVLVKFCLRTKISLLQNVLIDITNTNSNMYYYL